MYMFFWWGTNIKDFLFPGFNINSVPLLVATCFFLLIMGILMEFLGLVQAKIRQAELIARREQLRVICPSESDTFVNNGASTSTQRPQPKKPNK